MENLIVTPAIEVSNENVSNELKNAENEASAKQIKKSSFRKKVEKEQKAVEPVTQKKKSAKDKKEQTKKLAEVVAVVVASENKYLYLFQKSEKLSAVEQKKKRSAIRRKLFSFADAIYLANKQKNTDGLLSAIKEFKAFHVATYCNQKLEVKNIFTSETDAKKVEDLKNLISIIKKNAASEFIF